MIEEQIRAYRLDMRMSQQELAEKLNITQAALSQYESGKRPISNSMLEKLVNSGIVEEGELSTTHSLAIEMELLSKRDYRTVEDLIKRLGTK